MDILGDILSKLVKEKPKSEFLASVLLFYRENGGLSKAQLQGVIGHAKKVSAISSAKIATLEAIMQRKHTKHRSTKPEVEPISYEDETVEKQLTLVLSKFPEHKRALFLQSKYQNRQPLSTTEKEELSKFAKLASR